jgi:hypothetical protein
VAAPRGDASARKEVPNIVATIAHDIWLASILALASVIGLVAIVLAVSRRLAESEDQY